MRFILFTAIMISSPAFGAIGVQHVAQPNYTDYNSMMGMCTADGENSKQRYFQSSYCMTIYETLMSKNSCVKDKVDELRARYLQNTKLLGKRKNTQSIDVGSCTGANPDAETMDVIAAKEESFAVYLMQLFSAIAAQNSNWQSEAGGTLQKKNEIRCTENCGLLGISLKDMNNDKYACGCQIANKEDNQKQMDATMDAHLNLRCGITIALTEVLEVKKDKDGNEKSEGDLIGNGKRAGRTRDGERREDDRSGLAKIFKVLEDPDVPDEDSDKPVSSQGKITARMKNYCEFYAFNKNKAQKTLELVNKDMGDGTNALGFTRGNSRSDTNGTATK